MQDILSIVSVIILPVLTFLWWSVRRGDRNAANSRLAEMQAAAREHSINEVSRLRTEFMTVLESDMQRLSTLDARESERYARLDERNRHTERQVEQMHKKLDELKIDMDRRFERIELVLRESIKMLREDLKNERGRTAN